MRESNRLEASEIGDAHMRVIRTIKRIIGLIDEKIASIEQEIYLAISSAPTMKKKKRRLLTAGKTKMQALGAAMRKLIQIRFGGTQNTD